MLYEIGRRILATYLIMAIITAAKIGFIFWPRHTNEEVRNNIIKEQGYNPILSNDLIINLIRVLSNIALIVKCGVFWPKEVLWDVKWMIKNIKMEREYKKLKKKYGIK